MTPDSDLPRYAREIRTVRPGKITASDPRGPSWNPRDIRREAGRSTARPDRGRIERAARLDGSSGCFRRGVGGRGLRDAAPIELTGRQDGGSIPGCRPMWGAAFRASLAIVLRVTSGMLAAVASLAPEPTVTVAPALPLDAAAPVAARPGTPGDVTRLDTGYPAGARHEERRRDGGAARVGRGTGGEGVIRT